MAETKKSHDRRLREGWFDKYVRDPGIDIGCVGGTPERPEFPPDALNHTFRRYDLMYGDGDAQLMADVPDETFLTVYASHVLEHLNDPIEAIRNWYRILKPGGYLIINVPSMLLYEKQTALPSRWNGDHKTMWLRDADEYIACVLEGTRFGSHVHSLDAAIGSALHDRPHALVELRTLDEGHSANGDNHPSGEYSIEAIIRKGE